MYSSQFVDYEFKVIVVGDFEAGKTSLMLRHRDGVFIKENAYIPDNWDPCDSERICAPLTSTFYRSVHGVIYCCPLGPAKTNKATTLHNIKLWQQEISRYVHDPDSKVKMLAGTKADLLPNFNGNFLKKFSPDFLPPGPVGPSILSSLPKHVLHYILLFLSATDVVCVIRVNSVLARVAEDDALWYNLFRLHFSEENSTRKCPTWKLEYREAFFAKKLVNVSDIQNLSERFNMSYYITSAKLGTNIDELFYAIACKLLENEKKANGLENEPEGRTEDKSKGRAKNFFNNIFKKLGSG
eukprot:Phypoly_transcript_13066.p1 GENE.Phypoly_transcript_13066~~Phypoly_transcript_13066.p1  ORF type:complete len:297 (+),score=26.88 Phypoly_transcript_13066:140-1030(+)